MIPASLSKDEYRSGVSFIRSAISKRPILNNNVIYENNTFEPDEIKINVANISNEYIDPYDNKNINTIHDEINAMFDKKYSGLIECDLSVYPDHVSFDIVSKKPRIGGGTNYKNDIIDEDIFMKKKGK